MGAAQEEHGIVIVGAGIAGLAAAVALKLVGVQSLVLERSHELRATGAAIGLYPNAWRALEALGVAGKLSTLYEPFEMGRFTNMETGETRKVHLGSGGKIWSVHRKVLLEALAEELPPGSIRFGSRLISIRAESLESSSHPVSLHFEDGATIRATGGGTALEDADVLTRCVCRARTPVEFAHAIERYVGERRWRVAGVTTAAYIFGSVQQVGTVGAWQRMVVWFRDCIFYKFLFVKVLNAINSYDCGVLDPSK